MCFYVFSEQFPLHIKYVSEIVSYKYLGRPQVNAEILVSNPASSSLDSFHIVYPNRFLRRIQKQTAGARPARSFRIHDSEFRDESDCWISEQRKVIDALWKATSNYIIEYSSDNGRQFRTVRFPRHDDPTQHSMEVTGLIGGRCDLRVERDFGLQAISDEEGFTLFNLVLDTPLDAGESRWFRFYFEPRYLFLRKGRTLLHCLLLFMLNQCFHSYEICGPLEIRGRYLERVRILLQGAESDADEFAPRIRDFLDRLEANEAHYDRLDLHLWPRDLHVLFEFLVFGNIFIKGDFPRILDLRDKRAKLRNRRFYSLESTNHGEPNHMQGVRDFRILFCGRTHFRILEAFPTLVFIAAAVWLLVSANQRILPILTRYAKQHSQGVTVAFYFLEFSTVVGILKWLLRSVRNRLF